MPKHRGSPRLSVGVGVYITRCFVTVLESVGAWPGDSGAQVPGLEQGPQTPPFPICLSAADRWLEAGSRAKERSCACLVLAQPGSRAC